MKNEQALACAGRHGNREGPGIGHCDPTAEEPTRAYSRYPGNPRDIVSAVRKATEAQGARRRRRASVCMEVLVFLSPEFFKPMADGPRFDPVKVDQFYEYVRSFAEREFGVAAAAIRLDLDETSPHASIFVVPVSKRRTKLGKVKLEVSVRDRFGRRWQLSALQTSFADHMKPLGAVRGKPKAETGRFNVYFRDYHTETAVRCKQADAKHEALIQEEARLADERARHETFAKMEREALAKKMSQISDERAKHENLVKAQREELARESRAFRLALHLIARRQLYVRPTDRGPELRLNRKSVSDEDWKLLADAIKSSPELEKTLREMCLTASAAGMAGGGDSPPKPSTAPRKTPLPPEPSDTPSSSPSGPGF